MTTVSSFYNIVKFILTFLREVDVSSMVDESSESQILRGATGKEYTSMFYKERL